MKPKQFMMSGAEHLNTCALAHTHTHVHAHSSSRLYITQQIKHTWAPKHMLNKMWIINYTKANKDQKLNGWSSRFCCRIICHLSKHDIYLNHCRDVSITELICTVILQHKPRCDFTLNLQMIFTMSTQNISTSRLISDDISYQTTTAGKKEVILFQIA